MRNSVKSIIRGWGLLENTLLLAATLSLTLVQLAQIILRNIFHSGITWGDPFSRVALLWVVLAGAMIATREQHHLALQAITRNLDGIPAITAKIFTYLISAAVCGVLAYYSVNFVAYERSEATIAFWEIPNWWCELIMPLAFTCMSWRFLWQAAEAFFNGIMLRN